MEVTETKRIVEQRQPEFWYRQPGVCPIYRFSVERDNSNAHMNQAFLLFEVEATSNDTLASGWVVIHPSSL